VSIGREQETCRAEASKQNGKRDREGGSNSVVESQPSKLLVAGSIPVSRSIRLRANEPTRYGVMARRSGPDAKAAILRSRGSRASCGWQPSEGRTKRTVGKRLRSRDRNGRLVGRSREATKVRAAKADVAQLAERVLGKDEVTSSILVIGSSSARDAGGDGPSRLAKRATRSRTVVDRELRLARQHATSSERTLSR
jgi:ribosomal protein L34